jgi:hypothetical protein
MVVSCEKRIREKRMLNRRNKIIVSIKYMSVDLNKVRSIASLFHPNGLPVPTYLGVHVRVEYRTRHQATLEKIKHI